jgi:iron(II)-dependent oxidoreductase
VTDFSFRNAMPAQLIEAFCDARDYTLALFEGFAAAGYDSPEKVPVSPLLNPPLWELGHMAWFAEWYVLRDAQSSAPGSAQKPSMLTKGDDWFDSNTVPHRSRWNLGLPSTGAMKTYCHEVLDRVIDKLERAQNGDDASLYPYRLALAHEYMHQEAFSYTLHTLDLPLPARLANEVIPPWAQGDVHFDGGAFKMGSAPGQGFVFDNEKWTHARHVGPFVMDATLVSNAQFMEFIDDGGYQNPQYWNEVGRAWLMQQERSAPKGWVRDGQSWERERFGQRVELSPRQPVRHVSLHEARAYCAWSRRRLPTEEEWEFAALSDHPALRWGDLWEWTDSVFLPYEGFAAGAYREYSAPWFSTHQVLRGASFATPRPLRSPKFRNFYLPERSDIFVGFRTLAP